MICRSRESVQHRQASGGRGLHLSQDFFHGGLRLRETTFESAALREAPFRAAKSRDRREQRERQSLTESCRGNSRRAAPHGCSNWSRIIHPCCPSCVSTPYQ